MITQLGPKATRIADAIVDLVERANGGVTLREVENKIPGFRSQGDLDWDFHVNGAHSGDNDCVFWSGMSKAGTKALENVIYGRRVAIQIVSLLNYLLEGDPLPNDGWVPIVLLPAKGANLDMGKLLARAPEALLVPQRMKPGWRVLTPQPLRFDADLTTLFSKGPQISETKNALVGH